MEVVVGGGAAAEDVADAVECSGEVGGGGGGAVAHLVEQVMGIELSAEARAGAKFDALSSLALSAAASPHPKVLPQRMEPEALPRSASSLPSPPPTQETALLSLLRSIEALSFAGHLSDAFAAFSLLLRRSPPSFSLLRPVSSLLRVAASQRALIQGEQLHARIISLGFQTHPILVAKLVSFYCELGLLKEARVVVEGAKDARAVPWNLLIRACNRKGFWKDAIFSYKMMCELGVGADVFTYPSVLRACGEVFDLNLGKVIHGCVNKRGLEWDLYVWNSLIGMYVKCKAVDVAREVFDEMGERDVVTWNCMISGYASEGTWEKALSCYN
uniref:Pentatricopeptide repeat-containing protein n=1 Tax=Ananas comosus var. bracteatus TaxID=296719 RepID=A0A6V7Q7A3_ANACO|nr:unnamed protein product [Ananas comosus var. bracteatus]